MSRFLCALRGDLWSPQNVTLKGRHWLLKRPKVVPRMEQHGIDPKQRPTYNFRHSWACNYLHRTGDVFGCALVMGASVKVLQARYFHMDEEKLHERYLQFMDAR